MIFQVSSQEVMLTRSLLKSIRRYMSIGLASRMVMLAKNKRGPNFSHDDMECNETETTKLCNDVKIFNEWSHSKIMDKHVHNHVH